MFGWIRITRGKSFSVALAGDAGKAAFCQIRSNLAESNQMKTRLADERCHALVERSLNACNAGGRAKTSPRR